MDDVAVMMRIDSHRDGRGMTKTVDITWEDPTSGFLSATTHYELAPTLCRGRDERAGSPRVTILECIVPNTLTVEVVRDQSPKGCTSTTRVIAPEISACIRVDLTRVGTLSRDSYFPPHRVATNREIRVGAGRFTGSHIRVSGR